MEKSIEDFSNNFVVSTNGTKHKYKKSSCKRCDNDHRNANRKSCYKQPPVITGEEWKPCPNFEGIYEVSNFGNVRTVARVGYKTNGRLTTIVQHNLSTSERGTKIKYYSVFLSKDGKKGKHYSIHVLVAKAFIDNPNNLPQVNHIDSNTFNNHYENLEWVTNKENQIHSILQGRRKHLSQRVLILDKKNTPLIIMGSIKKAAEVTGVHRSSVRKVCLGKYSQAKGFKFQFAPSS